MTHLSSQFKLTTIMGVLAFLSILLSHLALTDIRHAAEPDLTVEWWVLRVSAAVIIAFIAVVFRLLLALRNAETPG